MPRGDEGALRGKIHVAQPLTSKMKFYFVYVLKSLRDSSWYIGFTENLKTRLEEHNTGGNTSTKNKAPYELIYFEGYLNKLDALGREKFLKSGSGRRFIKKQLNNYLFGATSPDVRTL